MLTTPCSRHAVIGPVISPQLFPMIYIHAIDSSALTVSSLGSSWNRVVIFILSHSRSPAQHQLLPLTTYGLRAHLGGVSIKLLRSPLQRIFKFVCSFNSLMVQRQRRRFGATYMQWSEQLDLTNGFMLPIQLCVWEGHFYPIFSILAKLNNFNQMLLGYVEKKSERLISCYCSWLYFSFRRHSIQTSGIMMGFQFRMETLDSTIEFEAHLSYNDSQPMHVSRYPVFNSCNA